MARVEASRVEELRARLERVLAEKAREREEAERLAREFYAELEKRGFWWLTRRLGRCEPKKYGEWCTLRLPDGSRLGLDTYNGYLYIELPGLGTVYEGVDERGVVRDKRILEKAISWIRGIPGEVGDLVEIAYKAEIHGALDIRQQALAEIKRILGLEG